MSVRTVRALLALAACFTICNATGCFVEDQSAFPTNAMRVVKTCTSWYHCVIICEANATCVASSYSETRRLCHLHAAEDFPPSTCGTGTFKRYLKTTANCISPQTNGSPIPGATYVRTNISREHGLDPCYPPARLHPELVNFDGVGPVCPLRKLDGSEGPVLGLNLVGDYDILPTSDVMLMSFSAPKNYWIFSYDGPTSPTPLPFLAGACIENDRPGAFPCICMPIRLHSTPWGGVFGTFPAQNVVGACPGKKFVAGVWGRSGNRTLNGDTTKLFCAGGEWMAGENAPGNYHRITGASCVL